MTTPLNDYAQPAPRTEKVLPGLLLALLAIPIGIVLWVIIWNFGYVSLIVGFLVAGLSVFLYKKGSGGPTGLAGIVVIAIITLVTVLLGFIAGLASDYARMHGLNLLSGLGNSELWSGFSRSFPTLFKANLPYFGIAVLAGLIGVGTILRSTLTNRGRGVNLNALPADLQQYFTPAAPAPGTQNSVSLSPELPVADATNTAAAPLPTPGVPPVPPVAPAPATDATPPAAAPSPGESQPPVSY